MTDNHTPAAQELPRHDDDFLVTLVRNPAGVPRWVTHAALKRELQRRFCSFTLVEVKQPNIYMNRRMWKNTKGLTSSPSPSY